MIRKCILSLLLLLLMSEPSWAAKTIICATTAEYPPMEFQDQDGKIIGYTVDFLEAAGKIAGFTVEFKKVPRKTLFPGLKDGSYDAVCASGMATAENRKEADFSQPYYTAPQVMVVNAATRIYKYTSWDGRLVGAQKGTNGLALLQTMPGVQIRQYDDIGKAMADLSIKKLNGVVTEYPVGTYYAKTKYNHTLTVTDYLTGRQKVYDAVAVKKGNKELLDLLNQGISTVKARDMDRELRLKWVTP